MSEWSANKVDKVSETWTALTQMFGPRLVRDYGPSAPDAWRNVIGAMRPQELANGLKALLDGGSGSVPTLPQFIKACRSSNEAGGMERNHSPERRIERKFEPIEAHANKCLFAFLWSEYRAQVSEQLLSLLLAVKTKKVEQYKEIFAEDPTLTGKDIHIGMFAAWHRAIDEFHLQQAR